MTHRQIINRAMLALGQTPITGALSTTLETDIAVTTAYDAAWRDLLESNAWSDLLVELTLEPVEESMDPDEVGGVKVTDSSGRYRYTLPPGATDVYEIEDENGDAVTSWEVDSTYLYASADGIVAVLLFTQSMFRFAIPTDAVSVQSIRKADGKIDQWARKRGSYVYSKQTELVVSYVSGDGLIPADLTGLDTALEPVMPSQVQDAVAYRLASLICFKITQNEALQQNLDARFNNALLIAKASDMRAEGSEDFWGMDSPNQ